MYETLFTPLYFVFLPHLPFAYELGTESWDRFMILDPYEREMGLTYPRSWLQPGTSLLQKEYYDSSYTYARWDQLFAIDQNAGANYGMSSDIVIKYIPYSFPHRWSAAMEMINYKGPSPTGKNDVVLRFQHQKGSLQYYHTNNTQTLSLTRGSTVHHIRSRSLNFDYKPAENFMLKGGMDYNLIEQKDTSSRNHDTFHQFAELDYVFRKGLVFYGVFEHRQFWNVNRHSSMLVFRPGIRFKRPNFFSHLAIWISPQKVFPIAQIAYRPNPFYIETYLKVRNPLPIIMHSGYQYAGAKAGLNIDGDIHKLHAGLHAYYDFAGNAAAPMSSFAIDDFGGLKATAEYRYKRSAIELYGRASVDHVFNHYSVYYYPELSTITAGCVFRAPLAGGKLLLDGDLNTQYIIHDDPDNVDLDPHTLIYTLRTPGDYAGDWKINMRLKAKLQSFSIAADLSAPLKAGEDLTYYLYEGIYTSSDLMYGNTLYAGIYIEWFWWK
ncbi:MAG: hypothetical protein U5N56_12895 [Candidatus Marinimicrobia bacterium]|nr:hypothetical protein [Candidatus Neomarinimicrobiota bacterium]